jgi:hypothetical protein
VQHPDATDAPIPAETVRKMVERRVVCALLANTITGKPWADLQKRIKQRADSVKGADSTRAAAVQRADSSRSYADSVVAGLLRERPVRPRTAAEAGRDSVNRSMLVRRANAEELIRAGCVVAPATDNYRGAAPEFERQPKPETQAPGIGTILSIEGLVELGMTPMQAIVAATKNGAFAMKLSDQLGTIETGKVADMVLLGGDPLADIHNIRRVVTVMKEGQVVDVARLPLKPVYNRPVPRTMP